MNSSVIFKSMVAASKVIRGITNEDIVKALGITNVTLFHRMKNPDSMRVGELRKLIELLGWSDESVMHLLSAMHLLTYQDDGELG